MKYYSHMEVYLDGFQHYGSKLLKFFLDFLCWCMTLFRLIFKAQD